MEIETGYGVEGILPDAKVCNIIEQEITPSFKQGDFNGGILAGTKALVVALKGDAPAANIVSTQPSPEASESLPFGWLAGLGGGGVVLAAIAYTRSRRPEFIEPEGRSRTDSWFELKRPKHCADCKQPMEKLDATALLPHLSQPEQIAQEIGSVKFEGWQCPNCHQQLTGLGIHIRACVKYSTQFSNCPICQELTVKRTQKVLRHATQYSEGKRQIIKDCQCCSYHHESEETIPRLPPPPPPPPPSSSSGGGFSSGGGSFGGGSFGGGSSGGGGAGGSW